MHPKILTALTLVVLGTVVANAGVAHAAPTNPTPARATSQTTNQTAPTLLQQNLLTLIKAGQAMEAETQVKQAEIEKKYQPKVAEAKTDAQIIDRSIATPELLAHISLCRPRQSSLFCGLERVMGIEPTRPAWKAGILAIELHPHILRH